MEKEGEVCDSFKQVVEVLLCRIALQLSLTLHLASSRNLSSWVRTTRHLNRRFLQKEHTTMKSVWVAKEDTFLTSTVHHTVLSLI